MSSVSDALITWLKTFNPLEYWKMNKIDTDMQPASDDTYAVVNEPTMDVKKYISGLEEHTDYYQVSARLDTQKDADRRVNTEWFEALKEWVTLQNRVNNLPVIVGATVSKVELTSNPYIMATDGVLSVYAMTIAISYTKHTQED